MNVFFGTNIVSQGITEVVLVSESQIERHCKIRPLLGVLPSMSLNRQFSPTCLYKSVLIDRRKRPNSEQALDTVRSKPTTMGIACECWTG